MEAHGLGGRLPLQRPENLPPAPRSLYDRLTGGRLGQTAPFRSITDAGELIGPFNAFLHAPAIGAGFIDFHEAEEHATPLSPRLREVVILSVGAVWEAEYELYAHRAVAIRVGIPPDAVLALASGQASDHLTDEERAVQRFTLELSRDRRVGDGTYAAAASALGHEGLVAAAFLATAYTATCMMLNAFAVPAPGE